MSMTTIRIGSNITVETKDEAHPRFDARWVLTGEDGYVACWGPDMAELLGMLQGMYAGTTGKYQFELWGKDHDPAVLSYYRASREIRDAIDAARRAGHEPEFDPSPVAERWTCWRKGCERAVVHVHGAGHVYGSLTEGPCTGVSR